MERAEKIGFGVATAGHVLLFAVLFGGLFAPNPLKLNSPTPIQVDLVTDVALESSAPKISLAPPPPATAPELGPQERADTAPPPPEPAPEPEPAPPPRPAPTPPKPAAKPVERAKPKPPTPALPPKPAPAKPTPAKPKPAPAKPAPAAKPMPSKPAAKPTAASKPVAAPMGKRNTSLALDDDIEQGAASERSPRAPAPIPGAAKMSPQAARALNSEISRQIYPWLRLPSGADVELLVAKLNVRLAKDGRVIGNPTLIGEVTGINESNRPQAAVFAERAIQAVVRASPFKNLPPEYYEEWKELSPLTVKASLVK